MILPEEGSKLQCGPWLSNLLYEVSIKPVTYGLTFVDQQIHVLPPWLFNKLQLVELNSAISIFVEHWLIKFNMLIKWANSTVHII